MSDENFQKNVLGEKLESCSNNPLTGWFRDGCCTTNEIDHGVPTVWAKVATKFFKKAGKKIQIDAVCRKKSWYSC